VYARISNHVTLPDNSVRNYGQPEAMPTDTARISPTDFHIATHYHRNILTRYHWYFPNSMFTSDKPVQTAEIPLVWTSSTVIKLKRMRCLRNLAQMEKRCMHTKLWC